jgi:hypothetical protein
MLGGCGASAIYRRSAVLRQGFSDNEVRRKYHGGGWQRIRRGAYTDETTFLDLDAVGRHRLLIDALLPDMAPETVLSHQSAAVVYGCPPWNAPLGRVCVTRNRRHGGRIKPNLRMHCAPLHEVAIVGGLRVTTPARTVVDVARTLPEEAAVIVGDALAGTFGIAATDLAIELERARFRHGIAAARRVVARLDARSESAGESCSRLAFERLGLPAPKSQGNVFDRHGKLVGRVDFYYEKAGVLCEFDGRLRYGRLLRPGQDPSAGCIARSCAKTPCAPWDFRWSAGPGTTWRGTTSAPASAPP